MDDKTKQAMELAAILVLNAKPHSQTLHKSSNAVRNAVNDACALITLANKLQRCAERQCNGIERWNAAAGQRVTEWTEQDAAKNERAVEKARAEVERIASEYRTEKVLDAYEGKGVAVQFNRDPRGAPIKIAFKSDDIWVA